MALATLSVDLVAKLANFERDLGHAARIAEKNSARIESAFKKVSAGVAYVFGGVTVSAITAMVKAQIDAIDGFNDLKDATGASIENISALDSLARRTGVTFDTVGSSLVKFNSALSDANDPAKGAGAVFKALGLDVEKLKKLDPAEALRQTAVALSGFADDGNKARAVQELFGKSLREIAPLLRDLGEEGKLVAKTTTEEAEAAEKFNKELFKMQANITDIARDIAGPLVSAMNKLIERFREGAKDGESFYGTLLRLQSSIPLPQIALPGQLLGAYDRSQGGASERLGTVDQALQDPTLSASERAALEGRRAALRARVNEQYAEGVSSADMTDALSRRLSGRSLNIPIAGKKGPKGPDDIGQGAKLAESLSLAAAGYSPDFIEKMKDLNAAHKAGKISLDGYNDSVERLIQQQPFMKKALADVDTTDALDRQMAATERARKSLEEMNAELDRLSGRTGDDRKRQLTEALEARLAAGEVFSKDELDRIVRGIGGVNEAINDTSKSTMSFADVFESRFEQAIVKGEKLKDVLKGLAQDLLQLYLRENFTKPMAKGASDWLGGAIKGLGGWGGGGGGGFDFASAGAMDSFLGFASGGVMTGSGPVPLRKYAAGGVANSPQLAMFGEGSMAEAYVPLPDGRRIPVAMKGGGGRPLSITQNITVGDVASMAAVDARLRESQRQIASALDRRERYGRA